VVRVLGGPFGTGHWIAHDDIGWCVDGSTAAHHVRIPPEQRLLSHQQVLLHVSGAVGATPSHSHHGWWGVQILRAALRRRLVTTRLGISILKDEQIVTFSFNATMT
jgi:hypothetical protein